MHLTTVHRLRDPRIFLKEVGTLRDAGFDVHLVAQHIRTERVDGVPVTALPMGAGRRHRLRLMGPAFRAVRRLRPALVHFHDPELIPVAYALKRATGARIVYDMHEDYGGRGGVEGRALRLLERWCFWWVDHVVLASDSLLHVVEGAGVAHTVLPNYFRAPSEGWTDGPEPSSERLELLYAGVQANDRGLNVMLDVVAGLRAEGVPVRLTLAGICFRTADRQAAEMRIEREGLATSVECIGWRDYLPWERMIPLFRRAHVGLALLRPLPNHATTIPTKFYEYLHFGLPILATDMPRWRALVEAHGCGAIVPYGDVAATVAVLRRWWAEPATLRAYAVAARRAAPRYAWEQVVPRLLALYKDLLGRTSR